MKTELVRLKRRGDFLRVARTQHKWVTPGLILQAAPMVDAVPAGFIPVVRIGFTVSRKVGNAVVRNRVRRRLRALAAAVLPEVVRPGQDLVLIGRTGTRKRTYADLLADLKTAVHRLGVSHEAASQKGTRPRKGGSPNASPEMKKPS
ncbi:MAG: rnpA [Rhodospirillaceae bacterium]|nr:MAG: rnpA [Rhodospirillaceae bacterium]